MDGELRLYSYGEIMTYAKAMSPDHCDQLTSLANLSNAWKGLAPVSILDINERSGKEFIVHEDRIKGAVYSSLRRYRDFNTFLNGNKDAGYTIVRVESKTSIPMRVDRESVTYRKSGECWRAVFMLWTHPGEGGALHLPRQGLKIIMNKGGSVIFPASYTHPYILEAPTSTRDIVVSYICE